MIWVPGTTSSLGKGPGTYLRRETMETETSPSRGRDGLFEDREEVSGQVYSGRNISPKEEGDPRVG